LLQLQLLYDWSNNLPNKITQGKRVECRREEIRVWRKETMGIFQNTAIPIIYFYFPGIAKHGIIS